MADADQTFGHNASASRQIDTDNHFSGHAVAHPCRGRHPSWRNRSYQHTRDPCTCVAADRSGGVSPALPTSALPTQPQCAVKSICRSIDFIEWLTSVLTVCVNRGTIASYIGAYSSVHVGAERMRNWVDGFYRTTNCALTACVNRREERRLRLKVCGWEPSSNRTFGYWRGTLAISTMDSCSLSRKVRQ